MPDNQPFLNKEELHAWRKFWTSELGQKMLGRYQNIYEATIHDAMTTFDNDRCVISTNRAAGVLAIIQDINAGINAADEADKEAKESESKKG